MTHSTDLIMCILSVKQKDKLSYRKAAEKFGVSVQSIINWEKGILPTRERICQPTKISNAALEQDIAEHPDDFQYERAARFNVTPRAIGYALARLKITRKKRRLGILKQMKISGSDTV